MRDPAVEAGRRIGTGLAVLLYPVFSAIAFLAHPNLLSLEVGGDVSTRIAEFHGNAFMHFGHFVMLLGVPLLIVVAVRLMNVLAASSPRLGFVGAVLAGFGAVVLAVDKTALCLVVSAFEAVPEPRYAALQPGIEALFSFEGYLAILYLLPLLALGFLILGVGLYRSRRIPRWQAAGLVVSMLGMGVAAAVDIDLFGLVATGILALCFFPCGARILRGAAI